MDCSRGVAYEALNAVLSDDHNAEAGDAALQRDPRASGIREGEMGLQRSHSTSL